MPFYRIDGLFLATNLAVKLETHLLKVTWTSLGIDWCRYGRLCLVWLF